MESTQKFMNPRFSVSGSELAELLDIPATEVRRLGAEGIFDTYKVHDRLTKYDPDQAKAALEAHRAELLGEDEETADDDQDELVEEAEDLEESADQVDGDDEDLEEEAPAPARKVAKAPRKAPAARIPRRAPGRPAKKGSAKRKAAGLGGFPVWRVAAVAGGSAMVGSALGRALAHALLGL